MSKTLRNRITQLEAHHRRDVHVMGTIVVQDERVVGLAPFIQRLPSALNSVRDWARNPRPGFVFLWVCPLEEYADCEVIPIDELGDEARRLVEPYTAIGTVLHLVS